MATASYQCCKVDRKRMTDSIQWGKRGNDVMVIFERPTIAAKELGIPLIGRTGVNLCRLFERLRGMDSVKYKKICTKDVEIWNVCSTDKKMIVTPDDYQLKCMKTSLKRKRFVLCFGGLARDLYTQVADGDKIMGKRQTVIELCHLGDRGISYFFWNMVGIKNIQSEKLYKGMDMSTKLDVLAKGIDVCCNQTGFFSQNDFVHAVRHEIKYNFEDSHSYSFR